ncbi:MAG TPA: ABC transporter ATP-binding protein [Xanthomonadales bacterium]|nr:ABC transporter ATP-binding protein [Xanthomonadales bacterium]
MNPVAASASSQPVPVLSLRQLQVSLPYAGARCELVKGIDLDLYAGQVTGLVGESGCGKTLTANALLGLLPGRQAQMHTRRFELHGRTDLSQLDETGWRRLRGRQLAMIFQDPQSALDPVFSIGQQMVRVIQRQRRTDREAALDIARRNLSDCMLADTERILASYPHQLSGGMRQRVMVALALSCEPAVLVADEVTSALDISSRDQVLALLRRAAVERGIAILLISHDLAAVARICDQVLVMYAGRIVESGPTSLLLSRAQHPYTAALLQATARITDSLPARVQPIAGRVQALHQAVPGCSFAERCQWSSELCVEKLPKLDDNSGNGHQLACHHPLKAPG